MTITLDQIPGIVVDAAVQQALSDISNNQKHIPVKFHENCGQTQAGIWEPSIDFIRIIYQLRYLGLPWTNGESGLDTDRFAGRPRAWTVRGHGQAAIVVVDWMRARTDHERGCGLVVDWTRLGHGHGHRADTRVDISG